MLEWQRGLAPDGQRALVEAVRAVSARGGDAVTVEDLLLSLLDTLPSLVEFLRRGGVDQDELIRTIQCEQPLSAVAAEVDGLSTELVLWLAEARAVHGDHWISVYALLQVLVFGAERFQGKAYVPVLEQIPEFRWLQAAQGAVTTPPPTPRFQAPVLVSERLLNCANRLIACAMHQPRLPIWIKCDSADVGAGLVAELQRALALQSERGVPQVTRSDGTELLYELDIPGIQVLDGVTPTYWAEALRIEGVRLWIQWLRRPDTWLILRSPSGNNDEALAWLEAQFDGPIPRISVPAPTAEDTVAILHFRHSELERHCGVQIQARALDWLGRELPDPVRAEACLRTHAALLRWEWQQGPVVVQQLENQARLQQQKELICQARGEPASVGEPRSETLSLWRTAESVDWYEHRGDTPPVLTQERLQALLSRLESEFQ